MSAITVVGNATADAELRYTQGGLAVTSLTVAENERKFNKSTNEWDELEPTFYRVSIWREYAEQVAATIRKGDRVIVTGKLKVRSYEDKEGVSRTSVEIDADEVGPALRYATAVVTRVPKGGNARGSAPAARANEAWATTTDETPW